MGLADVFEQLGYQQENPGLRNSFLAAAYELRSGIPQGAIVDSSGPDVILPVRDQKRQCGEAFHDRFARLGTGKALQ